MKKKRAVYVKLAPDEVVRKLLPAKGFTKLDLPLMDYSGLTFRLTTVIKPKSKLERGADTARAVLFARLLQQCVESLQDDGK